VAAISTYLWAVLDEARVRSYNFNAEKIATGWREISIPVTLGQLEFEFRHLRRKLRIRDQARLRMLAGTEPLPHPMLRVTPGGIEPWEIV